MRASVCVCVCACVRVCARKVRQMCCWDAPCALYVCKRVCMWCPSTEDTELYMYVYIYILSRSSTCPPLLSRHRDSTTFLNMLAQKERTNYLNHPTDISLTHIGYWTDNGAWYHYLCSECCGGGGAQNPCPCPMECAGQLSIFYLYIYIHTSIFQNISTGLLL